MKKYHVHSARPVIPPKHMEHPRPKPKSMGFVDKTFIIVALISIGYILFIIYQKEILALLQRNPQV